jgi:steroid delta-isomerase-like uncharacterized protein
MAPSDMQTWFEEYKKIWEPPFKLEAFLNLHTENVIYNDLTIPKAFKGREELREFYVRVLEAIPNFSSRYDRFYQQGDVVITEGALVGDQTGMYRGSPPSNKHVDVPWVQFLLFRGEQIYEVHDYYDRLDFLRQMGIANLDFSGQPIEETGGTYKADPD